MASELSYDWITQVREFALNNFWKIVATVTIVDFGKAESKYQDNYNAYQERVHYLNPFWLEYPGRLSYGPYR